MKIPFNEPYIDGLELNYLDQVLRSGHLSGNGNFTKRCHEFFEKKYNFKKVLLTNSCTDALEMCSMLINIKAGDEVIVPSYTFVTTALAFVRQGAKIVLADSEFDSPNVSLKSISKLINAKTKAIVVVHYAGMSINMDLLNKIVGDRPIAIIEDAAHAVDGYFNDRPLGGIGHLGVFSFHQTKNITSGEGGLLVINDDKYIERANIIWEKGTNRFAYSRGEVDKYEWVDVGSSFLPSELNAAMLWGQLMNLNEIQSKRTNIWDTYYQLLQDLVLKNRIRLPKWPLYSKQNGHTFYFYTSSKNERQELMAYLKTHGIQAFFHYTPLHLSKYYLKNYKTISLPNAEYHAGHLLRLPMYTKLSSNDIQYIVEKITSYFTL